MQEIIPLLEQYFAYLHLIQNHTKASVKSARMTWHYFLKQTDTTYLSQITKDLVEKWLLEGRMDHKWKASTYRTYHKHINGFFNWLAKKGKIPENFVQTIEKPKLEKTLPRRLSQDESEIVLLASRNLNYAYAFERKRNYAIIAVMLFAGLRKCEVINLKIGDLDLISGTLSIVQGKGSKDRLIPICSRLNAILQEYIADRQRLGKVSEYLFTAVQKDRCIEHRCIQNLMYKLRKRTGLDFSAHTLRHSFATLMLEGGCDIYTLSKIMGHNKITTTTIYLACSTKLMLSSIEKHPLN